jgi:transposase
MPLRGLWAHHGGGPTGRLVGHQFGPQLTALIAYLTVVCRMPRLVVQRFLAGVLQIPISLGSTQAAWEETRAAVATAYADLEAALPHEAVLNVDETGHRTDGAKRWLWAFVARTLVVYRIAASRGSDVLTTVLGERFPGCLGCDRWSSYLTYVGGQRQFCWAHFRRNLLSALDLATTPSARRFCREALVLQRRLFRLWHRFRGDPAARGGPITRDKLIAKVRPIATALFTLGDRHLHARNKDVRNLAVALCQHHDHFFTFVFEAGVEPTNNAAERALRTAVQWRKISFGTRSQAGRTRRRTAADDRPHLPTPGAQRARLPDRRHRGPSPRATDRLIASPGSKGLNCYDTCKLKSDERHATTIALSPLA